MISHCTSTFFHGYDQDFEMKQTKLIRLYRYSIESGHLSGRLSPATFFRRKTLHGAFTLATFAALSSAKAQAILHNFMSAGFDIEWRFIGLVFTG